MIREDQAHRILENLETLALAVRVVLQSVEAVGRDIQGMLNGRENTMPKVQQENTQADNIDNKWDMH